MGWCGLYRGCLAVSVDVRRLMGSLLSLDWWWGGGGGGRRGVGGGEGGGGEICVHFFTEVSKTRARAWSPFSFVNVVFLGPLPRPPVDRHLLVAIMPCVHFSPC